MAKTCPSAPSLNINVLAVSFCVYCLEWRCSLLDSWDWHSRPAAAFSCVIADCFSQCAAATALKSEATAADAFSDPCHWPTARAIRLRLRAGQSFRLDLSYSTRIACHNPCCPYGLGCPYCLDYPACPFFGSWGGCPCCRSCCCVASYCCHHHTENYFTGFLSLKCPEC